MQGVGTLQDLIQFVEATRMRMLERRVVVADEELAERIAAKPGQELHEAHRPALAAGGRSIPVTSMHIYVRPEHGNVLDMIDDAGQPVFSLIERQHGVRIEEVRQQIVAVTLDTAEARVLKARAGRLRAAHLAPVLRHPRPHGDGERGPLPQRPLQPQHPIPHPERGGQGVLT